MSGIDLKIHDWHTSAQTTYNISQTKVSLPILSHDCQVVRRNWTPPLSDIPDTYKFWPVLSWRSNCLSTCAYMYMYVCKYCSIHLEMNSTCMFAVYQISTPKDLHMLFTKPWLLVTELHVASMCTCEYMCTCTVYNIHVCWSALLCTWLYMYIAGL